MSDFDPFAYTITVKRAMVDGEYEFVASVRELPEVVAYESTYPAAYEAVIDALKDLHQAAQADNRPFPDPESFQTEFSGRVTLRIPIGLHQKVAAQAAANETSLNTYLATLIAEGCERWQQAGNRFHYLGGASSYGRTWVMSAALTLDSAHRHLQNAIIGAPSAMPAMVVGDFASSAVTQGSYERTQNLALIPADVGRDFFTTGTGASPLSLIKLKRTSETRHG
jgi:predicted RNase H-like HicB family nuclease